MQLSIQILISQGRILSIRYEGVGFRSVYTDVYGLLPAVKRGVYTRRTPNRCARPVGCKPRQRRMLTGRPGPFHSSELRSFCASVPLDSYRCAFCPQPLRFATEQRATAFLANKRRPVSEPVENARSRITGERAPLFAAFLMSLLSIGRLLRHEHAIPIAEKTVTHPDGMAVCSQNVLPAGKGAHQHQQARLGQVKVGQQRVHHSGSETPAK